MVYHQDNQPDSYIMTSQDLDYNLHVHVEFGEYAQTHEEHINDTPMWEQMVGTICLGPTGNNQGSLQPLVDELGNQCLLYPSLLDMPAHAWRGDPMSDGGGQGPGNARHTHVHQLTQQ